MQSSVVLYQTCFYYPEKVTQQVKKNPAINKIFRCKIMIMVTNDPFLFRHWKAFFGSYLSFIFWLMEVPGYKMIPPPKADCASIWYKNPCCSNNSKQSKKNIKSRHSSTLQKGIFQTNCHSLFSSDIWFSLYFCCYLVYGLVLEKFLPTSTYYEVNRIHYLQFILKWNVENKFC